MHALAGTAPPGGAICAFSLVESCPRAGTPANRRSAARIHTIKWKANIIISLERLGIVQNHSANLNDFEQLSKSIMRLLLFVQKKKTKLERLLCCFSWK